MFAVQLLLFLLYKKEKFFLAGAVLTYAKLIILDGVNQPCIRLFNSPAKEELGQSRNFSARPQFVYAADLKAGQTELCNALMLIVTNRYQLCETARYIPAQAPI